MLQDVGSHQGWIGEQSSIDVVGLLARLLFEGGDTAQLADIGVHIEIQIKLDGLGHIALDVDRSLFGIDAAGQVFSQDGAS